jgi:sortase A
MAKRDDAEPGTGRISGALTGPDIPPPRKPKSDPVRTTVRTIGEVLITLGLVFLLFVVYEVYWTDVVSAGKQRVATQALDDQWQTPGNDPERVDHFDGLGEGAGFAKMYIPSFGADYHFTIVEGTTEKSLEVGPGHYTDTEYPGLPGNFAVAGHRVGKGAPFNDLDLIRSCDAIIVETKNAFYVYRVLPMADEVRNWAEIKKTKPACNKTGSEGRPQNVDPIPGEYAQTVGLEIVKPTEGGVIAAVPHHPDSKRSKGEQERLLTLTTCHPKFSDKQRLIVHAVMVDRWAKNPANPHELPPELKET